jgi:hypothetical protein
MRSMSSSICSGDSQSSQVYAQPMWLLNGTLSPARVTGCACKLTARCAGALAAVGSGVLAGVCAAGLNTLGSRRGFPRAASEAATPVTATAAEANNCRRVSRCPSARGWAANRRNVIKALATPRTQSASCRPLNRGQRRDRKIPHARYVGVYHASCLYSTQSELDSLSQRDA